MSQEVRNIVFNVHLQPVQIALYKMYENSSFTKIGFGGPRGGTKSHSADSVMLMRRIKYCNTNGLFVMKVYQDMLDIHIRPMLEAYPELEEYFNRQDMIMKLPNGSFIRFLSGDNLETFKQRKGRGFADIMIDQSELFSQDEIEFLYTINRSVNPLITPKTLLCFNPGNVGHSYHKRVFFDKIFQGNEKPEDFGYLVAYGWDNAYWSIKQIAQERNVADIELIDSEVIQSLVKEYHKLDNDTRFEYFIKSDYGKILNGLPTNKRKAEMFGDMEIFEGMFFSDFRYGHHIKKDYEITWGFTTIGGLDYGNCTVLEILQRDYEGTVIAADECYLPDLTNPSERANALADFLLERKLYKLQIIYDTDMEISQISNVGFDKTPIQIFREVFKQRMKDFAPQMLCVTKKSVDKHKNYRAVCNEAVKEYLHVVVDPVSGEKKSKLYISSKCKYLIKFFSETIYPPDDNDGLDFFRPVPKIDHPYDGFKYPFMHIYTPKDTSNKQETPQWLRELQQQQKKVQRHPMTS